MTTQTISGLAGRHRAATSRRPGRRRLGWLTAWTIQRVIICVIALLGAAVLLYPTSASWFAEQDHAATVVGYAQAITSPTPREVQRQLQQAMAYNHTLPSGPLQDPYSGTPAGKQAAAGAADKYLHTLNADPNGVMGIVSIPSIDVNLPIYHGTAPATLDKGVGHLFGSALPVGGPGTHSVLTGHSGVVGSTLFTHLNEVTRGTTFTVTILNQVLTYQVDQIQTVLPDHTDALEAVPGHDYVTLVTCTPIGVNTHRLLVRGVRIPNPPGTSTPEAILGRAASTPPPWWIPEAALALLLILGVTTPLGRRPPRPDHRAH